MNIDKLREWFENLYINPESLRPENITRLGCFIVTDVEALKPWCCISLEVSSIAAYLTDVPYRSVVLCMPENNLALVLFGVKIHKGEVKLITSAGDIELNKVSRLIELPWNFDYFGYYT